MAITAAGLGSSLDVNSIVTQLMTIEQQPLVAINRKEASFQAKISALGSLKSALSALQTSSGALVPATGQTPFQKFGGYRATVADTSLASASASSTAVAGIYSLEINQLASAQRIESVANPVISNGTLTIEIGTYSPPSPATPTSFAVRSGLPAKTLTIDASNNTIEGVRDAINKAGAGLIATVVNGTGGKQLILQSAFTGTNGAIRLSGTAGLAFDPSSVAPDNFTPTADAKNAAIKVNGIAVSSETNTVSTAVDGITINLLKGPVSPETAVSTTLTVSRDSAGLKTAIESLVKSYNDANKTMRDLGNFDASSKKGGTLLGDSTLRSAQNAVRNVVNNIPAGLSGTFTRLSEIGVTAQLDGSLTFDSAKFTSAVNSNYEAVTNVVAAYGAAFKTATEALAGANGSLTARTDGLNRSIEGLDSQREALGRRLVAIEARYRKQFSSLDTLISGLTKTSNFLQQQLANLPKAGG